MILESVVRKEVEFRNQFPSCKKTAIFLSNNFDFLFCLYVTFYVALLMCY
jgi:hypothetical protein